MYLDDVYVGMTFELGEVTIEKEKMLEFAREYDPIPLHLDEDYAKTTRYGGLIAPGVMTFMTVWAKFLEQDPFGDALIAGASTSIHWQKPCYPGDVLKGRATVTKITRRNAYNGVAEITVEAWNRKGELVLTDVTESVVKYRA